MNWGDMDYEERLRTLYTGTRDGMLVKQIAYATETTPGVVKHFAEANGIPVRSKAPKLQIIHQKRVLVREKVQAPASDSPTIHSIHMGGGAIHSKDRNRA